MLPEESTRRAPADLKKYQTALPSLGVRKCREEMSGKRRTIMNKARRIVVAGLGAMTPAFIATDQVQARAADGAAAAPVQSGALTIALDQETLKNALLELSPPEKLRIAGDRIRLAAKAKTSTQSSAQKAVGATMCVGSCIYTKNHGGSARRPPRQAR
jgi:hypothetical protein